MSVGEEGGEGRGRGRTQASRHFIKSMCWPAQLASGSLWPSMRFVHAMYSPLNRCGGGGSAGKGQRSIAAETLARKRRAGRRPAGKMEQGSCRAAASTTATSAVAAERRRGAPRVQTRGAAQKTAHRAPAAGRQEGEGGEKRGKRVMWECAGSARVYADVRHTLGHTAPQAPRAGQRDRRPCHCAARASGRGRPRGAGKAREIGQRGERAR